MRIIADSGSTGTDWALLGTSGSATVHSAGINPVHMDRASVETILNEVFPDRLPVSSVYFYGAGCIPSRCVEMVEIFQDFFDTNDVFVDSDLLGGARSLFGKEPGVACILGTGSNSGLYNGEKIVKNVPPLGYVLGDEGSGADLGKRLVGDLLKGLLPEELVQAFYRKHPLDYPQIVETVYRKTNANRFLAGFTPFLKEHLNHPLVGALVETAFSAFIERNLLQYDRIAELPVSFVGSIAYYFEQPLRKVLSQYGLQVGKIEQSPLKGLIRYHE